MSVELPWSVHIAWHVALLPLAWVAGLGVVRWRLPDAAFWYTALALGISWPVDYIGYRTPTGVWPVTYIFPVMQSTLVAAVLLLRLSRKIAFALGLSVVAALAIRIEGTAGPDWLLYPVAGLAVAYIAWPLWQVPLRGPMLVYFGLGAVAWFVHVRWLDERHHPMVATWYPFEVCRVVGILWFCWAAVHADPTFRLSRSTVRG